ncbi:site-2 protease family protein [Ectobacillus ponti]|uniref:Site-2 protease family protein n=1 Tax=Ectobacillus ponti TaxID=2961894 RepID=A0AA41XAX5_9BACI|nr:site-2 protease family protein [Ectobacillus ponti]MCP8968686.1 site-2 protease family protein [Ectobacillus ponti]
MKKSRTGAWGIVSAIGVFLLSKLKWVLGIVKLAKFSTAFSMLLSLGAYAAVYGWKFGVALVYLLFVHEMGHVWAARRLRLPTSPALFLPFVGAVVGLKQMPKNARDEAFLAYMGPLFGLLSFLPAIPLYIWTGEPFWALVIVLGGSINFFNLIPVSPLDGGRIAGAISTKLWVVGLIILLVYAVAAFSIMGFFLVLLGVSTWFSLRKRQKEADDAAAEEETYSYYLQRLRREWEAYGAVHRTVFQMENHRSELQLRANRGSLPAKEARELLALDRLTDAFRPFDYVMEGEEQQEQLPALQEAFQRVEEQLRETAAEREGIRNYYQLSGRERVQTLIIYLLLLAVLGYSAYYGNQILLEHP